MGRLLATDFAKSTPCVTFAHSRLFSQTQVEDGVKAKPVRIREEIPEFEDPSAELAKLSTDLVTLLVNLHQ